MNLVQALSLLKGTIKGTIKLNELMKNHTTWRIGGPADIMVFPTNSQDVAITVRICRELNIPWFVLGGGSNLLVQDRGIRGIVIKTAALTSCNWLPDGVEAGAGLMLPRLARESIKKGLSGLEWCVGIPASLGGAVTMNAGIGSQSFADTVTQIEIVDEEGRVRILPKEELFFDYRYSIIQQEKWLITKARLKLTPGILTNSENYMRELWEKRLKTQPLELPNAGSVFKNPPGDYAGRMIEAVGAKGLKCGNAEVSEKHANFIVNRGSASAHDVLCLVEEIKRKVAEKFKIELQLEIHVVGE